MSDNFIQLLCFCLQETPAHGSKTEMHGCDQNCWEATAKQTQRVMTRVLESNINNIDEGKARG